MGDSHSAGYEDTEKKMDYEEEKPKKEMDYEKKKDMSSYEALEMACGSMMMAIKSDDVKMLCRSFKAAYKACEMYEEEMEGGSHNSHGSY
jgi:hypothetical protein